MKKSTAHVARTIVAAVIVTGVGVHAQNSSVAREDESNITVTGCLQPAVAGRTAVGTSGSAANTPAGAPSAASATTNAADNQSFMLVNARVGAAPGGGSGVTTVAPAGSGTNESAVRAGSIPPSPAITGATDSSGNSAAGGMYILRSDNPELPRHVGQEVQISGRLIAESSAPGTAGASSTGAAPSTSTSTTKASADRTPQLDVRTIRVIASVCAAR